MRVEKGPEERPNYPPLTPEQKTLFASVERLIEWNAVALSSLVVMDPAVLSIEDLKQSGRYGAVKALREFRPEEGKKYPSLAAPRIRGAMIDEIRRLGFLPRSGAKVRQALDLLQQSSEQQGPVSDEQIAELIGFSVKRVRSVKAWSKPVSLDAVISPGDDGEEGLTFLEAIADHTAKDPLQETIRMMQGEDLVRALNGLNPRIREVVVRHVILGEKVSTIAKRLLVSKPSVDRLCRTGLDRLRCLVNEDGFLRQPLEEG